MLRRAACVLALTLAFFLLLAEVAHPAAPESFLGLADTTWGAHPCAGQVVVTRDDTLWDDATRTGPAGEARGIKVTKHHDGREEWHLASCEITIDTGWWELSTDEQQCRVIVHEVGHLAFHRHEKGGVMAATPEFFEPCAKPPPPAPAPPPPERTRDRIVATIEARTGARDIWCGPYRRPALICEAYLDTIGWVRYRAVITGRKFKVGRIPTTRRSTHGPSTRT